MGETYVFLTHSYTTMSGYHELFVKVNRPASAQPRLVQKFRNWTLAKRAARDRAKAHGLKFYIQSETPRGSGGKVRVR